MPKNKSHNRRMIITVVVIVTIALVGLTMVQIDPAAADRNSTASALLAKGSSTEAAPSTTEKPSVTAAIVKMVSALALVIIVAYLALLGLKKLMGRRYGAGRSAGALEVIQSTYVGPHKAVSLVRVGKRSVLVGVTDQQITNLTELDAEETEAFLGEAEAPVPGESFSHLLSGAAARLKTVGLKKKQAALET